MVLKALVMLMIVLISLWVLDNSACVAESIGGHLIVIPYVVVHVLTAMPHLNCDRCIFSVFSLNLVLAKDSNHQHCG